MLMISFKSSFGDCWLQGKVVKKLGSAMYSVVLNDGRNVRMHVDQTLRVVDSDRITTFSNMDSDDSFDMRIPRSSVVTDLVDEHVFPYYYSFYGS